MREILFRGKRLDNGEWVQGYLYKRIVHLSGFHQNVVVDAIEVSDGENPLGISYYTISPDTVGQYTGMNIYGKKIFEGDILKLDYIGPGRGVQGVAEVVFKYGKFCMPWGHRKELVGLDGFANTTMEIIGNIHDNPDLLKGE